MLTCRVTPEFMLIKLHTSNNPLQRQGCTSWLCKGTAKGLQQGRDDAILTCQYCSTWSWHHKYLLIQNTFSKRKMKSSRFQTHRHFWHRRGVWSSSECLIMFQTVGIMEWDRLSPACEVCLCSCWSTALRPCPYYSF